MIVARAPRPNGACRGAGARAYGVHEGRRRTPAHALVSALVRPRDEARRRWRGDARGGPRPRSPGVRSLDAQAIRAPPPLEQALGFAGRVRGELEHQGESRGREGAVERQARGRQVRTASLAAATLFFSGGKISASDCSDVTVRRDPGRRDPALTPPPTSPFAAPPTSPRTTSTATSPTSAAACTSKRAARRSSGATSSSPPPPTKPPVGSRTSARSPRSRTPRPRHPQPRNPPR